MVIQGTGIGRQMWDIEAPTWQSEGGVMSRSTMLSITVMRVATRVRE